MANNSCDGNREITAKCLIQQKALVGHGTPLVDSCTPSPRLLNVDCSGPSVLLSASAADCMLLTCCVARGMADAVCSEIQ